MAGYVERHASGSLGSSLINTPKNYQDEDESRDSKFKTIWDGELKNDLGIVQQKAFVLLLSWHENADDLGTAEEVTDSIFAVIITDEARSLLLIMCFTTHTNIRLFAGF